MGLVTRYFEEDCQYHILDFCIRGYLDSREHEYVFMVTINRHGSIQVDLMFMEEFHYGDVIRNVNNIHHHKIDMEKPSLTVLADGVKVIVDVGEWQTNFFVKAENQCWYRRLLDDGPGEYGYYQPPLILSLFSTYNMKFDNAYIYKISSDRVFNDFYQTEYDYKCCERYNKDSEQAREKYWFARRYAPQTFLGSAEEFEKWIEKKEANYQKGAGSEKNSC